MEILHTLLEALVMSWFDFCFRMLMRCEAAETFISGGDFIAGDNEKMSQH